MSFSSPSQQFFVMGQGTGPNDAAVQKVYPGLILNPSEVGGEYGEIREINGSIWFVTNAQYNTTTALSPTAANAWNQILNAATSWAWVLGPTGAISRYTAAAAGGTGPQPITFTATTFNFPANSIPNSALITTAVTAINAGTNISVSQTGGNATINVVAAPTFNSIQSQAGGTSGAYVSPVFSVSGGVTANTEHEVRSNPDTTVTLTASTQGSTTITLSGEAAFSGTNTYCVVATFDATGGFAPAGAVVSVLRNSSTQFTIYVTTSSAVTATYYIHWVAKGT